MLARGLLLLALVAGTGVLRAAAQTCSSAGNGTGGIVVQGSAEVEAMPDIAKVTVSVQSTKESATAARDEAAKVASAVIAAVQAIVPKEDITTLDVNVAPQMVYPNDGSNPRITGYTFTQRIQAKILNVTNDALSAVVDAAVSAGGNNLRIESIATELSPPLKQEATNAARAAAVEDAMAAAKVLAKASGVALGALRSVSDVSVVVPTPYTAVPSYANAGAAAREQATPVNLGTTDVTASVQMVYAIKESS